MRNPEADDVLDLRNGAAEEYSLEPIRYEDLTRLAKIANGYLNEYFVRRPDMRRLYRDRFLLSALCQGAAIHAARPRLGYGVKDFDVWSFFELAPCGQPRGMFQRNGHPEPFGDSSFGDDPYHVVARTRRVDLFWRSIQAVHGDRVRSLQSWLAQCCAQCYSSRCKRETCNHTRCRLRQKAVLLIDPPQFRGRLIWLFDEPAEEAVVHA